MRPQYLFPALFVALTSCGGDNNGGGAEVVDAKFQGEWQGATKAEGAETPAKSGCMVFGTENSKLEAVSIGKTTITYSKSFHIGATNCNSDGSVNTAMTVSLGAAEQSATQQVLQYQGYSMNATVSGAKAVKFLNDNNVCGYNQWQEKVYSSSAEAFKGCTTANGAGLFTTLPIGTEIVNMLVRLKTEGQGLSVATKTKAEGNDGYDKAKAFYVK